MPCGMCIRQSRANFAGAPAENFTWHPHDDLTAALQGLSLDELTRFEHPLLPCVLQGLMARPSPWVN